MKMTQEEAAKDLLYGDKNTPLTSANMEEIELAKMLLWDVACLEGKLAVMRSKDREISELCGE